MQEMPSPDESKLIKDEEIKESLEWMNGKSAVEIAAEMARLRKEAILGRVDLLTGLKNDRGLKEAIEYFMPLAVRQKMEIAVTVLDLDNLKTINDKQGHAGGDKLLKDFSQSLLSIVRKSDVVARIGGDEFMVVGFIKNKEDIDIVTRKLANGLKKFQVSIGSSLWLTGEDFNEAKKKADGKMYQNKRERKSNV